MYFTGGEAFFPLDRKGSLLPPRSLSLAILCCLNQRADLGSNSYHSPQRPFGRGMFLRRLLFIFFFALLQSLNWFVLLYPTPLYYRILLVGLFSPILLMSLLDEVSLSYCCSLRVVPADLSTWRSCLTVMLWHGSFIVRS